MRVANHAAGIVVGKLGTAVSTARSSSRASPTHSLTKRRRRRTVKLIVTGAAGS